MEQPDLPEMQNTFGRDPSAKIDEVEIAEETCPTTPKQNAASQKVVPESFAEIESYIDLYLENNGGDLAKAIVEFGESGKRIRNFVESGKGQMTLRILQKNPQIVPPDGKSNGSINYYAKFQEMFPSAKKFLISRSEFYKCARVKKLFDAIKDEQLLGRIKTLSYTKIKSVANKALPVEKQIAKLCKTLNPKTPKITSSPKPKAVGEKQTRSMKVKNIFSGFTKAQKFYKRAIDSAKKRISPESNQIITDWEIALGIFSQKTTEALALLKAQSPKATKRPQKGKTQSQEGGYIER